MTADAATLENDILRGLKRASEARGLTLHVNPAREIVPTFLGDYQPDAIAVGPDGGIVFEVLGKGVAPGKDVAAAAKRVSAQKGWEFRGMLVSSAVDELPPIAKPTAGQVEAALQEVEALIEGGHAAAALMAGWAVLEALSRLARSERSGGVSPLRVIQRLGEDGYVERETAERLREMGALRNAVVHGDFSVCVPSEAVEGLLRDVRAIAADVLSVVAEVGG